MAKRLFLIGLGLLFIGLFFIFTFVVRSDALRSMDFDFTVKIQNNIPTRAYKYLDLITQVARFEVISILIFLLLVFGRQWWQMFIAFGLYIGAHLLELVGKSILYQPPPAFMFYKLESSAWFPEHYVPEGNSYPSGHSLRAFFFAVLISTIVIHSKKIPPLLKIGIVFTAFIFAGVTAIAKVTLGQHWTTDVLAGSLLGVGTALLSVGFFNVSLRSRVKK